MQKNNSSIDELVFKKLKELGISASEPCSDEIFLRRVHFDLTGTLPEPGTARKFLLKKESNKRKELIESLLKTDEFADYQAMKWCDILRIKSEFPSNLWPNAVQAYYKWIRDSLKNNLPYDAFVRELLLSSGSNFRVPPVNFYRAVEEKKPEKIAEAAALTFMGARIKNWDKAKQNGMAVFFSKIGYKYTGEWKEEIIYFDKDKEFTDPDTKAPVKAIFPDNKPANIPLGKDPRAVFADWLMSADNPWFAKNIVNRIWSRLMGRGIIHEPDDIRDDNLPQNKELLAFLEKKLRKNKYDLKHIFRLILNSQTYQLSSAHNEQNITDNINFSRYYVRRLEAEVLIDAICKITGTHENYSSRVPEPFTFIPEENRSITLADGSITSSFLEMFGRPPRDTGMESERNNSPSYTQMLHLLNSSHILDKIRKNFWTKNRGLLNEDEEEIINKLYLAILSRFPDEQEKNTAKEYMSKGKKGKETVMDIVWALINTKEFLFKH